MPRAIWKGAISFGMVAIPVKLYPATGSKTVKFSMLHEPCNSRIRYKRYCEHHEEMVDDSEIVKAYEYAKDQYVVMEPSDLSELPVPSTHTIAITQFVDLTEIDPVYFDRSYYLEPETMGQKPFMLLTRALEESGKVAIAKVSIRQKEHLCCIRKFEDGVIMETMYFPDEIRDTGELEIPEGADALSDQEMAMAGMLIDQLSGEFDAGLHGDEYRVAVEHAIEAKLGAAEPLTVSPAPAAPSHVVDLMAALKASVEAAKSGTNGATADERVDEEVPA